MYAFLEKKSLSMPMNRAFLKRFFCKNEVFRKIKKFIAKFFEKVLKFSYNIFLKFFCFVFGIQMQFCLSLSVIFFKIF
ncbi:hypothetical protein CQA43_01910 [Helicobacter ganmani]|uniref:Uncharacterized protein n=1 Tax=Helicobacter ganmani TaxID=60246 RepID=A0A3D8II27_9HELI|nr:hypothetical protein CQA43_01910 [Helicobacter ganmani]